MHMTRMFFETYVTRYKIFHISSNNFKYYDYNDDEYHRESIFIYSHQLES